MQAEQLWWNNWNWTCSMNLVWTPEAFWMFMVDVILLMLNQNKLPRLCLLSDRIRQTVLSCHNHNLRGRCILLEKWDSVSWNSVWVTVKVKEMALSKRGGGKEQKRYKSCLSCLCPCTADREWAVNVRFGKLQIAYRQSNSLAISNHFMHPEGQLDNYQI